VSGPGAPAGGLTARARLRRRLLLVGLVPLLLVALVGLKVVLMLGHDRDGRAAYGRDDHGPAAEAFAGNSTLNVVETWVAPFDEGTSLLADGEYDDALRRLDAALDHAPAEQRCTVLVNVALAHEALGDAAEENDDAATARERWEAGRDALADGDCPTDAGQGADQARQATAVDDRLADKLDVGQEQEQPQQQDQPQQPPPPSEEQKEKERKLDRRTEQGQQDRRDQQEYDEYDGSTADEPQW